MHDAGMSRGYILSAISGASCHQRGVKNARLGLRKFNSDHLVILTDRFVVTLELTLGGSSRDHMMDVLETKKKSNTREKNKKDEPR